MKRRLLLFIILSLILFSACNTTVPKPIPDPDIIIEPEPAPEPKPVPEPEPGPIPAPNPSPKPKPVFKTTKFAAFGDTPYTTGEFSKITKVFNEVSNSQMPFIVHVGDIFSSGTRCTKALYSSRNTLFSTSKIPFVIAIGDNEYNDCPKPEQALKLYREIILANPGKSQIIQGTDKAVKSLTLERQNPQVENASWDYQNIKFTTLFFPNFPGDYPLPLSRIEEILDANKVFLKKVFSEATTQNHSAVVLIMQSDPTSSCSLKACLKFNDELKKLVKQFGKPVLSINGDNHTKSFKNSKYQNVKHWAHLRPNGFANGWAEIVFTLDSNSFSVKWH